MNAREFAHAGASRFGLLKRPGIVRRVLLGAAAGAAGTTAINAITYIDMLLRGRPASETPAAVARQLEKKLGLANENTRDGSKHSSRANRREAAGALLGIGTGVAVGALYGLVRPSTRSLPALATGTVAGLAAMTLSDVPATLLGVTDPKSWRLVDWAADLGPHLAYGVATATAFDVLADPYD